MFLYYGESFLIRTIQNIRTFLNTSNLKVKAYDSIFFTYSNKKNITQMNAPSLMTPIKHILYHALRTTHESKKKICCDI